MLIVDGNNVSSPRRPWHRVVWGGQLRLVVDVALLTREWESCADVVFDGPPSHPLYDGSIVRAVQVWFSGARCADDRIVELALHDRPRGDRTLVATSDRELARRVQRLGAEIVSSETLRQALDLAGGAADAPARVRMPVLQGNLALLAMETASRGWKSAGQGGE